MKRIIAIVALAPAFAFLWGWLAGRGHEPSTPAKMFIAMISVTLSFVAMVGAAVAENAAGFAQLMRELRAALAARAAGVLSIP